MDSSDLSFDSNAPEVEDNKWVLGSQTIFGIYRLIATLTGLVLIILLFTKGFQWYWETAFPIVSVAFGALASILLLVGLVLSIPTQTRGVGGLLIYTSSLLYLFSLWAQCLGFSYVYVGKILMVIGFLLAGVGVFLMAFVGAMVQGEFGNAILIAVGLAIALAFYFFGLFICRRAPA